MLLPVTVMFTNELAWPSVFAPGILDRWRYQQQTRQPTPQDSDATGFTCSQECDNPRAPIRVTRCQRDRFRAYRHLAQFLSWCFLKCRENPGGSGPNLHTAEGAGFPATLAHFRAGRETRAEAPVSTLSALRCGTTWRDRRCAMQDSIVSSSQSSMADLCKAPFRPQTRKPWRWQASRCAGHDRPCVAAGMRGTTVLLSWCCRQVCGAQPSLRSSPAHWHSSPARGDPTVPGPRLLGACCLRCVCRRNNSTYKRCLVDHVMP